MLCENCRQHDATCHLTTIVGDAMAHRDLCAACFEASQAKFPEPAVPPEDLFDELREQIPLGPCCEYCGSQPCKVGTDFFAFVAGGPKQKRMCLPCSAELGRYIAAQLPTNVSGVSPFEQMAMVRRVFEDAEKHMKQWVSEKGPR